MHAEDKMSSMSLAAVFSRPIHFNISPTVFFSIWIGILSLIILMVFAALREKKKRQEGLSRLAMDTGCEFFATPDEMLAMELAQIQIQQPRLGGETFRNVMRGSYGGLQSILGDVTMGAGKSRTMMTVASFKFPVAFPTFLVCAETLVWRLAEKVGYKDIDLDDAPEFSRRFFLHADDEAAVRTLFTRDLTLAFETSVAPGLFVCSSGPWLTVYHPNKMLTVEQCRELKVQAESVAEAFRRAKSARA